MPSRTSSSPASPGSPPPALPRTCVVSETFRSRGRRARSPRLRSTTERSPSAPTTTRGRRVPAPSASPRGLHERSCLPRRGPCGPHARDLAPLLHRGARRPGLRRGARRRAPCGATPSPWSAAAERTGRRSAGSVRIVQPVQPRPASSARTASRRPEAAERGERARVEALAARLGPRERPRGRGAVRSRPFRARSVATVLPAGPPPTTHHVGYHGGHARPSSTIRQGKCRCTRASAQARPPPHREELPGREGAEHREGAVVPRDAVPAPERVREGARAPVVGRRCAPGR